MKILMEKRGMSRINAILFGIKSRSASMGIIKSIFKTLSILAADMMRSLVLTVLRIFLIYPIRIVSKILRFGRKGRPSLRE